MNDEKGTGPDDTVLLTHKATITLSGDGHTKAKRNQVCDT